MKKNIIINLFLIAIFTYIPSLYAMDIYMGTNVIADKFDFDKQQTVSQVFFGIPTGSVNKSTTASIKSYGVNFYIGLEQLLRQRFSLSEEFSYSPNSTETTQSSWISKTAFIKANQIIDIKSSLKLSLLPSYQINNLLKLYSRFGIERTQLNFKVTIQGAKFDHYSGDLNTSDIGCQLGLGLSMPFYHLKSSYFSVRLEYDYTDYPHINKNIESRELLKRSKDFRPSCPLKSRVF